MLKLDMSTDTLNPNDNLMDASIDSDDIQRNRKPRLSYRTSNNIRGASSTTLTNSMIKSSLFPKAKRNIDRKYDKSPGPQDYDTMLKSQFKTMALMRSPRPVLKPLNNSPGVGTYNVHESHAFISPRIPAIPLATSTRNSMALKKNMTFFPGPTDYSISFEKLT